MNEDYLWDKTGDDPEIERLENVLAVFRYQEAEAPVLPLANITPFVEQTPRRRFAFAFAFAAISTAVILLSVWFQISGVKVGSEKDLNATVPLQIISETRDETKINKIDASRLERVESVNQSSRGNLTSVRRPTALITRQNKTTAKTLANKNRAVALTSEEKYAYGQLMLALAITSSKLRIVQDTITRIEDGKNTAGRNER